MNFNNNLIRTILRNMKERTLNQAKAAEFVGVCADTLRRWRKAGAGPRFIEIPGGRVRYPVAELEKFLQPKEQTAA